MYGLANQVIIDISSELEKVVEKLLYSLTQDSSLFVCIDGEEGDYGIVKYYSGDSLYAWHLIYGGDREDLYWTEVGVRELNSVLSSALITATKPRTEEEVICIFEKNV